MSTYMHINTHTYTCVYRFTHAYYFSFDLSNDLFINKCKMCHKFVDNNIICHLKINFCPCF